MDRNYYKTIMHQAPFGFARHQIIYDNEGKPVDYLFIEINKAFTNLTGSKMGDVIGKTLKEVLSFIGGSNTDWFDFYNKIAKNSGNDTLELYSQLYKKWFRLQSFTESEGYISTIFTDITQRKMAEQTIKERMLNLTLPLDDPESVTFEDLFNIDDIQQLQDQFADATGVASIITQTDGTPITKPSNFTHLCDGIIRKTEKGCANCFKSDAVLGKPDPDGPVVQLCMSSGLWDAGAGISVGGKHIANWLVGQVRDETQTDEKMRTYARKIETDEDEFIKAFHDVPSMSQERFEKIAGTLFTLAKQLSDMAYQNIQQARFISEKEHVEETLRDSRIRLQNLIDAIPDMVWASDENERFTFASESWKTISGYSPQELIGKSFYDLMADEEKEKLNKKDEFRDGVKEKFDDLKEKRESYTDFLNWNIHKNGELRCHSSSAVPQYDKDGKFKGYIGIDKDITESIRAEEALRNEKGFIDMAIDSLPGVFYLFTEAGEFLKWNRNFQEVSGYTTEEIRKIHPLDLFPEEDKELIKERIGEVFSEGESFAEAHWLSKDGTQTLYYLTGVRIDFDGVPCQVGMGVDISERKKAEEEVKRHRDHLEDMVEERTSELAHTNAELERFAYIASHDLQEPLRMVTSYLQLLERRYKDKIDEDANEFINYAVDGAKRMQTLINDLLIYSRAGTKGIELKAVQMTDILNDTLNNLSVTISESNSKITYDPMPLIMGDRTQLVQLMQNLIGNAIKFRGDEPPEIQIFAEDTGKMWKIFIKDNGIGIKPDYHKKIFQVFQRLHTHKKYPGTGIGLAVCQKIVERHGGTMEVVSESGKGAVFSFTLLKKGEVQ